MDKYSYRKIGFDARVYSSGQSKGQFSAYKDCGIKYQNCQWTLDIYLPFAIWMKLIQSEFKLIYIFVTYGLMTILIFDAN